MTYTMDITSAANPVVKKLAALAQRKYREQENLFIVEGLRHVTDAVKAGWRPAYLAHTSDAVADAAFADLYAVAHKSGKVFQTTPAILRKITGRDNTQNVVAAFAPKHAVLADVAAGGVWVALENIRDPGNLGTIIRTADATGVAGIILAGQCCDPWSPEAVRASMGSFARVGIAAAPLADIAAFRPQYTGTVTGTAPAGAVDYRTCDYPADMILFMGNEQAGLSADALALCDRRVTIPMTGGAESLNLAVATAVMLFEVKRKDLTP